MWWLPPRLAWCRWRLRKQPVPVDGLPLSETERFELDTAWFALIDEEGTRRVAPDAEAAEMLAAPEERGGE